MCQLCELEPLRKILQYLVCCISKEREIDIFLVFFVLYLHKVVQRFEVGWIVESTNVADG